VAHKYPQMLFQKFLDVKYGFMWKGTILRFEMNAVNTVRLKKKTVPCYITLDSRFPRKSNVDSELNIYRLGKKCILLVCVFEGCK
jgi:hypothetical protein